MLAAANAFKNEHREIVFHFIEIAAVPVAEFTLFVKECDRPPFAVATGEFRALDRMSGVENPLKIGSSKSAENATQLDEELSVVLLRLGKPDGDEESEN